MQDVVNNLVSKYKILITEYEQMKKQKVVILNLGQIVLVMI